MRSLSMTVMAAAASLMLATAAYAQPAPGAAPPPLPEYGPSITLEQAMKIGNAALAEAKKKNLLEGIAIVDNAGRLVYFIKMDDLRQIGSDLAQGKARTSAMTKLPSKAYEDRVTSGGAGLTVLSFGITAAAGGLPIIVNGKMIGAIGVGGGPNGVVDTEVAQAGLDALK
jgi:glc operon protein GlcG